MISRLTSSYKKPSSGKYDYLRVQEIIGITERTKNSIAEITTVVIRHELRLHASDHSFSPDSKRYKQLKKFSTL